MVKFVVGNKADLIEEAERSPDNSIDKNEVITDKQLRDFAQQKKCDSAKVSARKNQGIDEVFQRLGERLIQSMP